MFSDSKSFSFFHKSSSSSPCLRKIIFPFLLICSLLPQYFNLEALASSETPHQIQNNLRTASKDISQLYEKNAYAPFWITRQGATEKAGDLLTLLSNSYQEGLFPSEYFLDQIARLWSAKTSQSMAQLDVLLTRALAHYLHDITKGRLQQQYYLSQSVKTALPHNPSAELLIETALRTNDLRAYLNSLVPQNSEYHLLKKALANYRLMEQQTSWPIIPLGKTITPGMEDDRISLIVQRLKSEYSQPSLSNASAVYTPDLKEVIIDFQKRFQLEADGKIGNSTISALNVPAKKLAQQIIINLERYRWFPHRLTGTNLLVNIPGFQLSAVKNDTVELQMPVVVGHVFSKTPMLHSNLRCIVFNPYWTIPEGVVEKEIVNLQQNNPDYLRENNIKIFYGWKEPAEEVPPESIDWANIGKAVRRYRFRQEPGPHNALGQLKFIFPNDDDIYLHGTTQQGLFSHHLRAYSHGCVRLSDPERLAQYLLKDNTKPWDSQKIREQIESEKQRTAFLDHSIGVYFMYQTVSVHPKTGKVYFYKDIYGKDYKLINLYFAGRRN